MTLCGAEKNQREKSEKFGIIGPSLQPSHDGGCGMAEQATKGDGYGKDGKGQGERRGHDALPPYIACEQQAVPVQ
jgi:hypothetical protein